MYFVCGCVADSVLKLFKVLGDIVPLRITYNQGVKLTEKLFKSNIADGMQWRHIPKITIWREYCDRARKCNIYRCADKSLPNSHCCRGDLVRRTTF